LSELTCLPLCTILGTGLTMEELASLVLGFVCPCGVGRFAEDPAALFHLAHVKGHEENTFSSAATRLLNDKYRDQIAWVARQSARELLEQVDDMDPDSSEVPGIAWGLVSDNDPNRQMVGDKLIHAIQRRALSRVGRKLVPAREAPTKPKSDVGASDPELAALSAEQLRKKVAEQAATIERMLEYISRTRPVPAGVQEDES
jgi:hypothetical protein